MYKFKKYTFTVDIICVHILLSELSVKNAFVYMEEV